MDRDRYVKLNYFMSAGQHPDVLTVSKSAGTDWSHVTMTIHGDIKADITIRSQEMAEQLHFMLGQMLRAKD
jgi:hypothetical protein